MGIVLFFLSSQIGRGAEMVFDYPELLVTPRASERLEMEAKKEAVRRWTAHAALQVSALTTATAAIIQMGNKDTNKDPDGYASLGGLAVSSGWMAGTLLLSLFYLPYSSEWEEIRLLPAKTERERLTRERLAEEALQKPARLGRRLNWISFASNYAISVYMLTKAKGGALSISADIVSMIVAATPIVFPYYWQRVANEQEDYKKKIYGPIAHATFFSSPASGGKLLPGLALSFRF